MGDQVVPGRCSREDTCDGHARSDRRRPDLSRRQGLRYAAWAAEERRGRSRSGVTWSFADGRPPQAEWSKSSRRGALSSISRLSTPIRRFAPLAAYEPRDGRKTRGKARSIFWNAVGCRPDRVVDVSWRSHNAPSPATSIAGGRDVSFSA